MMLWYDVTAGGEATQVRAASDHVHLLRPFHHLRLLLHAQPLHWCHHRELQRAEEKDECLP